VIRIILLIFLLVGCTKARFGDFTENTPKSHYVVIVNDSLDKLKSLYPPSRNELFLSHKTNTIFEKLLTSELKRKGFVVYESESFVKDKGVHSLAYVIDKFKGTDIFRVSLYVPKF
jgi:hypothetical protein